MPTNWPLDQPKAESVGVVDLFEPGTASPWTVSIGMTLPVSTVLVCSVSIRGALPKACAPRSVKLAATLVAGTGNPPGIGFGCTRIRCALAAPASAHEKHAVKSHVFNFIGMLPFALAITA